jgi:sugar (pentulose or hexulose) kinase
MISPLLAGIDLGTTSCKVVISDVQGNIVSISRASTPWRKTMTGREMDPTLLLSAVEIAVGSAISAIETEKYEIRGVGVTGMGQTGTVIRNDGTPLMPMISWDDTRAVPASELLEADFGDAFSAQTGLPVGSSWSSCQLKQVGKEYDISKQGIMWLGVPEWIVYSLSGISAGEYSLASQSGMYSVLKREWNEEITRWAGWHISSLPDLNKAGYPVGKVKKGPLRGALITIGGHDHPCGSVGAGAADTLTLYDSCGTAETLVRVVREFDVSRIVHIVADEKLQIGTHVIPEYYMFTASQHTTAAQLNLLSILRCRAQDMEDAFSPGDAKVERMLEGGPIIPEGAWSADEIWAAGLENVAESTAGWAEKLDRYCGNHERTVIAGGWSKHPPFVRFRSGKLRNVTTAKTEEPGALGAAMFAGIASGLYTSIDEVQGS